MAGPLRHRQTKEAETDMFSLPPPRHISTLPSAAVHGAAAVSQTDDSQDPRASMVAAKVLKSIWLPSWQKLLRRHSVFT
jgi:hypothetical protein